MPDIKNVSADLDLWSTGSWGNGTVKRVSQTGQAAAINDRLILTKIPRNFEIHDIVVVTEHGQAGDVTLDIGIMGRSIDDDPDRFASALPVHAGGEGNGGRQSAAADSGMAPFTHDVGKTDEGQVYLTATVRGAALEADTKLHFYMQGIYTGK